MTLGETHLSNDQSRQTLERLGQGGHSAVLLSPLRSAQSTSLVSSGKALVRGLFTTHSPALRGLLQMSIGFLQRKTHPDFSLEGNKVEKARNKHLGGWNCIEPVFPAAPGTGVQQLRAPVLRGLAAPWIHWNKNKSLLVVGKSSELLWSKSMRDHRILEPQNGLGVWFVLGFFGWFGMFFGWFEMFLGWFVIAF